MCKCVCSIYVCIFTWGSQLTTAWIMLRKNGNEDKRKKWSTYIIKKVLQICSITMRLNFYRDYYMHAQCCFFADGAQSKLLNCLRESVKEELWLLLWSCVQYNRKIKPQSLKRRAYHAQNVSISQPLHYIMGMDTPKGIFSGWVHQRNI